MLNKAAQEIREIINNYQTNNNLSFIESSHTYYIKNNNGEIISNMPSVSDVIKLFYKPFEPKTTKAFKACGGDKLKEQALLKEWADKGDYASNMGSRVHFLLEQYLINMYGNYKEIRQPIYTCDKEQIKNGDKMIKAGKDFIDIMHQRGAVLLDTEIVLGDIKLGYFGQPDKVWLMFNKQKRLGLIVTDWKTNQPKNFQVHGYTKQMKPPFQHYHDTALTHYYIQLPLYAKLLLEMLKGTKYENIDLFGGVVVLLKNNGIFEEFRVPREISNTIINLNIKQLYENN